MSAAGVPVTDPLAELIERFRTDPQPPPAIRIGAVGRRELPAAAGTGLEIAVSAILRQIHEAARDHLRKPEVSEQFCGALRHYVVTPLADGADRLIAGAALALPHPYGLGAILPFERAAYVGTFDGGEAATAEFDALLAAANGPAGYGVMTLDGPHDTADAREGSYRDCAQAVLWWSDIVLAVLDSGDREWNAVTAPETARHRRHGHRNLSCSAQTVVEAKRLGIPVIIVDAAQAKPPELIFPGLGDQPFAERLVEVVAALLGGGEDDARPRRGAQIWGGRPATSLEAYCRDEVVEVDPAAALTLEYGGPYVALTATPGWYRMWGWVNPGASRLARAYVRAFARIGGWVRRWRKAKPDPAPAALSSPPSPPSLPGLVAGTALEPAYAEYWLRYHRADAVATANSRMHRSVQMVLPILMLLSVAMGVLKLAAGEAYALLFGGLEAAMLLTAMTIMMAARRHHWMQTWLAARMLAETLRYAKFLLVAGRVAPFGDIMRMQATKRLGHNWVRAYARHALRAHPLSALRRGVDADPDAAREIARYVRHACIADQIGYHRGAIARNRILERTLWLAGEILSYAAVTFALAECAALIAVRYFKATPSPALDAWAPLLAIFLPAITAAVLSWRNVGENDAVAKRSEAMEAFLIDSDRRIAHAMTTDDFDLMTLGGLMVPVVRRLLRDVDGWAELFNSKETSMG